MTGHQTNWRATGRRDPNVREAITRWNLLNSEPHREILDERSRATLLGSCHLNEVAWEHLLPSAIHNEDKGVDFILRAHNKRSLVMSPRKNPNLSFCSRLSSTPRHPQTRTMETHSKPRPAAVVFRLCGNDRLSPLVLIFIHEEHSVS